ncbi:L-ribulose-5-phosphate 4-epimerase [Vibrio cholerae NCTC 8457]|nr:L-ribulose-5-phosphate 4-epimerase [Vibrio cholerae NCTC 8457]
MALATRSLNSGIKIQPELSDKHYCANTARTLTTARGNRYV